MKKKGEKAQITIFIILGILVVFIFISMFLVYSQKNKIVDQEFFSDKDISPELENLQANILMCNDIIGKKSLKEIGLQGGYYKVPSPSLKVEKRFLPYYYYLGEINLPTEETIKRSLEGYSDDNLQECYDMLKFEGFTIKNTVPKTEFLMNDKEVLMHVNADFTLIKENKSIIFSTKDHDITFASEIKNILGVARSITISHNVDAKMFCISCIETELVEKDLYLRTKTLKDNTLLIILVENHTNFEPYMFTFLNKYTGEEKSDDINLSGGKAQGLPNNP